jgi:hypothetical protein
MPAALAGEETEQISQTVKVDPGGTLRLKNFSGRVFIKGTDGPDVVVDAVRRGERYQLDRIKLDVHAEGSTVIVDANRRSSGWYDWFGWGRHIVETDLDVKVPRRMNLDVEVFSAPVAVEAVDGTHTLRTFSSRLSLDEVSGSLRIKSFSGSVEFRTRTWNDRQAIEVETFSGNITLHLPESASGTVAFSSFSGGLSSEMPLTFRSSDRRNLAADLGQGQGASLRLKTFSGNARIDR